MACQHQVRRCRPCCLLNPHIGVVCKWLQALVPVRLIVRHVISESLQNSLFEHLGRPVYLRMVGGGEIVVGAQSFAYGVDENGDGLLPVVSYSVLWCALRVDPLLQKRGCCCGWRDIPRRDGPRRFSKWVGYDQGEGILRVTFFNGLSRSLATNLKGVAAVKRFIGF